MHKMPICVLRNINYNNFFNIPKNCLDSLFTVISFLKVIDLGMVVCLKGNFWKCCAYANKKKFENHLKKEKNHVEIVIYILVISVALDICKDYRD